MPKQGHAKSDNDSGSRLGGECSVTSWPHVLAVAGLCAIKGWQQKLTKTMGKEGATPWAFTVLSVLRGPHSRPTERLMGQQGNTYNSFCYQFFVKR